jgi:hypothetical protein
MIVSLAMFALAGGLTGLYYELQKVGLGNPLINAFVLQLLAAAIFWLHHPPKQKQ